MLGKTIKYYRIQKEYSQQELADLVGVQKMTISNYENEKREPDVATVKKICKALDVSLQRFMAYKSYRSEEIVLSGKFRKNENLSSLQEQKIVEKIKYALERYLEIADILGAGCIGIAEDMTVVSYSPDAEENAIELRKHLGFPEKGAVSNLIQCLEDANVLFVPIDVEEQNFSGYSSWYKTIPIIAYNANMSVERQRFTIVHELVHLFFDKGLELSEKVVDEIAGRFLLTTEDCKRELGVKRKKISSVDIRILHDKYGISASCALLRVKQSGIINYDVYKEFPVCKMESVAMNEKPTRFLQLVNRAYNEDEIGISKVSELLDVSYAQAELFCS